MPIYKKVPSLKKDKPKKWSTTISPDKIKPCPDHGMKYKVDNLCFHPACLDSMVESFKEKKKGFRDIYNTLIDKYNYSHEDLRAEMLKPTLNNMAKGKQAFFDLNYVHNRLKNLLSYHNTQSRTLENQTDPIFEEINNIVGTAESQDIFSGPDGHVYRKEIIGIIKHLFDETHFLWLIGELDDIAFSMLTGKKVSSLVQYKTEVLETIREEIYYKEI